jgi:hypothetical protein
VAAWGWELSPALLMALERTYSSILAYYKARVETTKIRIRQIMTSLDTQSFAA